MTEKEKKITKCMTDLVKLYSKDKEPIDADLDMFGVHYKLSFTAEISTKVNKAPMELKDLTGIVINCKTEREAWRCCLLAEQLGWKCFNGYKWCEISNFWHDYQSETCYNFVNGDYGDRAVYTNNRYTIQTAQWFIDNFRPNKDIVYDGCKIIVYTQKELDLLLKAYDCKNTKELDNTLGIEYGVDVFVMFDE